MFELRIDKKNRYRNFVTAFAYIVCSFPTVLVFELYLDRCTILKHVLERLRIKLEPRIARLESKFNSQAKRVKCTCKFLPYFYTFVLQSIMSCSEAKDHKIYR